MTTMDEKAQLYMSEELQPEFITKDVVVYTYLNYYPKEYLNDYPEFFLNKLKKVKLLNENEIDILNKYLNMNNRDIKDFFNFNFVTPELIEYVGW
jgi:hypothetical protein